MSATASSKWRVLAGVAEYSEGAVYAESVAAREVRVPAEARRWRSDFDILHHTMITCHGGGSAHQASICLECERYVDCSITPDKSTVRVRCWWYEPVAGPAPSRLERPVVRRRLPRRTEEFAPVDMEQCASCGSRESVARHPAMSSVPICDECLEQSRMPVDYAEIGCGD